MELNSPGNLLRTEPSCGKIFLPAHDRTEFSWTWASNSWNPPIWYPFRLPFCHFPGIELWGKQSLRNQVLRRKVTSFHEKYHIWKMALKFWCSELYIPLPRTELDTEFHPTQCCFPKIDVCLGKFKKGEWERNTRASNLSLFLRGMNSLLYRLPLTKEETVFEIN